MAGHCDLHITDQITDLEALARQRFADTPLSEAEHRLLLAAPEGKFVVGGTDFDDKNKYNDPARGSEWGKERTIRAELIRWLCVDRKAVDIIDPGGLLIYAAKITGSLDLSSVTVPFPLRFARCY